MAKDKQVKIKVEIDQNPLKDLVKQFNDMKKAVEDLDKGLKAGTVTQEDYDAKVKVLSKGLSGTLAQATKLAREENRALLNEWKKGTIAAGEFQIYSAKLGKEYNKLGASASALSGINQYLWHTQNQVTLGTKSLLDPVTAINQKMGALGGGTAKAENQLRTFYREQRVGDRTMREGVSTIQMFSGVLGTELTGGIGQAAGGFQQAEFAVQGFGIAAASAKGKVGQLGQAILGLAGPLSALAAIGVGEFMLINSMLDRMESSMNRLRKAQGFEEKQESSWFMEFLSKAGGPSGNIALQTISAMAKGVLAGENAVWAAEHEIKLEEIVITGEKEKQVKLTQQQIALGESQLRVAKLMAGDQTIGKMAPREISKEKLGDAIGKGNKGNPLYVKFDKVGGDDGGGTEGAQRELSNFEEMAVGSFHRMGNTIGQTIGGGLTNAFGIGHTLVGQLFDDLTSQAMSFIASGILNSIFGLSTGGIGGVFGALFGSAFGGGKASGGAVTAGVPYIVGERGPEMFMPRQSGNIIPSHMLNSYGQDNNSVVTAIYGLAAAMNKGMRISNRQIHLAGLSGAREVGLNSL